MLSRPAIDGAVLGAFVGGMSGALVGGMFRHTGTRSESPWAVGAGLLVVGVAAGAFMGARSLQERFR